VSDWSGKTVLVTGAGGFIGSHLVERLAELGAVTRALIRYTSSGGRGWLENCTRSGIEVFRGDLCDPTIVANAMDGVDVVFHLAALIGIPYSYQAPASYVRTNIEGTLTVLEAARRNGKTRVVHTSTSEVYGTALTSRMTEEHPLQAQSPYSASKASADMLAIAYNRSFGLDVTIARPFNTYGPRQSTRAVIPTIIAQALGGASIRLGHLHPTRDFTYVTDTVDAFERIGRSSSLSGQVINVGSGQEISIGELAATIQRMVGSSLPIVSEPIRNRPDASEVDRLCADPSRAHTLLQWRPRVPLSEGLALTIEWMKRRDSSHDSLVYGV
jgi:NAD dependent epimerase/dehydratase